MLMTDWRQRIRAALVVAVAVAIAAAVAACGGSSSGAGTTAAKAAGKAEASGLTEAKALTAKYSKPPTRIGQTVALPSRPPTGKSFICLVQGSVPAVVSVCKSAGKAAGALGWKFSEINYNPASAASLQGAFSSALSEHPSMVGMVGLAPSVYGKSVIDSYREAKIPIIVTAAGPVPAKDETLLGPAYAPASTEFAGKRIADWFVASSGGNGKAVIVNIPSFTTLAAGQRGIESETKRLCSQCTTEALNVTLQQVAAGTVPAAVISYLQSHQNINYVLFTDGDWATGITQALKGADLSEVKVGGITPTAEQMSELKAGEQAAWAGYNFQYNGYAMIDIAARYAVQAPITTNDEIGPTQILTPGNVGDITEWALPADALEQFEKLWKVK